MEGQNSRLRGTGGGWGRGTVRGNAESVSRDELAPGAVLSDPPGGGAGRAAPPGAAHRWGPRAARLSGGSFQKEPRQGSSGKRQGGGATRGRRGGALPIGRVCAPQAGSPRPRPLTGEVADPGQDARRRSDSSTEHFTLYFAGTLHGKPGKPLETGPRLPPRAGARGGCDGVSARKASSPGAHRGVLLKPSNALLNKAGCQYSK